MSDAGLANRYLELLKKSLLDLLYIENEARLIYLLQSVIAETPVEEAVVRDIARHRPDIVERLKSTRMSGELSFVWPIGRADGSTRPMNLRNVAEFYHTMIGKRRLDSIHELLDRVIVDRIPGDLIETGVWRGGATIFMRGYLAAHGIRNRNVWVADSFAGVPAPTAPPDQGHDFSASVLPILAIPRAEVEELFRRYDLLDDRVKFLEGWFKDTLPVAPIERLALMRLDGDLYESTRDALVNLYHKLSPGGFVIVDDYNDFEPCKLAVDEFRTQVNERSPIQHVDWSAIYWCKGR